MVHKSHLIFGWLASLTDGCGYYRIKVPLGHLDRKEWTPYMGGNLPPSIAEAAHIANVVVGQRVSLPGPSQTWRRMAQHGQALVYEIDDDVWDLPESSSAHPFFRRPEVQQTVRDNIRVANAVTVTCDRLADLIEPYNPNVHVLPNVVPDYIFDVPKAEHEGLIVGWAGGPTHAADIKTIAPLLGEWFQDEAEVKLVMAGVDFRYLLDAPLSEFVPWTDSMPEHYEALHYDIGLAPLARHPFNLAKSPIKALEYAARGIPVIATDYGPYRDFVRHGETGFLARTPEDWIRYLNILTNDHAARAEMGAAALIQAKEHTASANAHLWADVYRSVA